MPRPDYRSRTGKTVSIPKPQTNRIQRPARVNLNWFSNGCFCIIYEDNLPLCHKNSRRGRNFANKLRYYQVRLSLGGSDDSVGAFEEHKQQNSSTNQIQNSSARFFAVFSYIFKIALPLFCKT